MSALGRLGLRKRRDRRDDLEAIPFAVDACECLVDGPFALLRLTGTGVNPPASLVVDSDKPASFEPLPSPDEGVVGGVWRAAFALPAELAEPGTLLWLLDGGEYMTDVRVPPPAESRAVAAPPAPPAAPAPPVAEEPPAAAKAEDPEVAALVDELKRSLVLPAKAAKAKAKEPEPIVEPVAVVEPDPVATVEPIAEPGPSAAEAESIKLVEAWTEAAKLREKLTERERELAAAREDLVAVRAESDGTPTRSEAPNGPAPARAADYELRLAEAAQAVERAEREASELREQVAKLEAELAEARTQIETSAKQAEHERERLATEGAAHERTAEQLQAELEKLKQQPKSRRRGAGRRNDDREVVELRTQLEARIAEQQERIAQLEQEAESFAARRDDALAESLRERVATLEQELRKHVATAEDLRALLESERELVAVARDEASELREQLAGADAKRVSTPAEPAPVKKTIIGATQQERAASKPPPWSALDDELLARIEKAKALTTS